MANLYRVRFSVETGSFAPPWLSKMRESIVALSVQDAIATIESAWLGREYTTKPGEPQIQTLPELELIGKIKEMMDKTWHLVTDAVNISDINLVGSISASSPNAYRLIQDTTDPTKKLKRVRAYSVVAGFFGKDGKFMPFFGLGRKIGAAASVFLADDAGGVVERLDVLRRELAMHTNKEIDPFVLRQCALQGLVHRVSEKARIELASESTHCDGGDKQE